MKRLISTFFLSLALALAAIPAGAAELFQDEGVIEPIGHGEVNWTSKQIRARGSGAPNLDAQNVAVVRLGAERAAKMDALRNILEVIKGIRITSDTTFGDQMLKSDLIRAKVEGMVKGARVQNTKYFSDGAVDIIVEMPISGTLSNLALPPTGEHEANGGGKSVGSGLIVDARGTGFVASLSPRVTDEAGNEVYGSTKIDNESALKDGLAGYFKGLEEAKKSGRVGDKPIVVKAVKINPANSSLVISKADADRLREPGVDQSFLFKGRVAIIVD